MSLRILRVFFSVLTYVLHVLFEMPEFEENIEHVNDIYDMLLWNDYAVLTEQRCRCLFGTNKNG